MRRTGTGSGGGVGMNKNVSPKVRTGKGAMKADPCGVAQIGGKLGEARAVEPIIQGRGYNPVKYGNEVALNVGKGGPGAGRKLYGQSGYQNHYGSGGPSRPDGGDIFEGFPGKKE